MDNASASAIKYATSMDAASIDTNEFALKQRITEVTSLAQNKSLINCNKIIKEYNNGCKNVGLNQIEFIAAVKQSNSGLADYLTKLNGAEGSIKNYIVSLVGAKAATVAVQAATMALNMAISFGVMAALSLAVKAVDELVHREEKLIDKSNQAASAIQSTNEKMKSNAKAVSDLGERYAELSQGVNRFTGANESLTTDEYAEFLDISNQLADLFPTLSRKYDENGNAILDLSGDVDTIVGSLNNLLDVQRNIANQEIVDNLPDLYKGIQVKSGNYKTEIQGYKDDLSELENQLGKISSSNFTSDFEKMLDGSIFHIAGAGKSVDELNSIADTYKGVFDEIGLAYEELESDLSYDASGQQIISGLNFHILDFDSISESDYNNAKAKIQAGIQGLAQTYVEEINNLNQKIQSTENENKANWSGLLSSISAWLSTENSYNSMSDSMQSVIQQMVNNVDFSSLDFSQWNGVEGYITEEIIKPIQDSPAIQDAFTELFEISEQDNSVGEYIAKVQEKIQEIASNSDFDYKDLLGFTGFDDAIDEYYREAKRISNILGDVTTEQLYSLSPDELTKAFDYVKEYGVSTWDDLQSALESKSFEVHLDMEAETEKMTNLFTAITESNSAVGASAKSIEVLKSRYQDLDGYDPTRLFERTTGGIHLNRKALEELEQEYESSKKAMFDDSLDALGKQYEKLTDDIKRETDAERLATLYAQRDNVLDQINDISDLASEYSGLTSAYNKWINAKNTSDDREGYEAVGTDFKNIQDLIKRGWTTDTEVTEYLDLLLSADQRTNDNIKDFEKLTKTIEGTNFSIMDFFQFNDDDKSVSDGLYNFLDAVRAKLGDEYVQINDGNYAFDFSGDKIEKVAKAVGMTTEMVQILEQAMLDANFDVIFDSTYSSADKLKDTVKDCADALSKLGYDVPEFNFLSTDMEEVKTQIGEAQTLLTNFTDSDGKINLDVEGAKEASSILATLIYRKSDLENSTLMNIEVDDNATSDIEKAIGLLQQFKDANANLEIQTEMGVDTKDAQAKVNSILDEMSKNQVITGDLQIDTSSVDNALATVNALTPTMMVEAGLNTDLIDGYVPEDKSSTVVMDIDTKKIDEYNPPNFTRKVTFNKDSYQVDRYNPSNLTRTVTYKVQAQGSVGVDGTAHARGTAFARGNWGTKDSGVALGGELGQELVVRNGRFFTIGDDGAEFFRYRKNDIVFNAEQTKQILEKGKITYGDGRGKALVSGTAFDIGSGGSRPSSSGSTHSASSTSSKSSSSSKSSKSSKSNSKTNSKSKNKSAKDSENVFDWIEVAIDRIERAIKNLDTKANSVFKSWTTRNKNLSKEISKVSDEISLQEKAYNAYIKAANSVGLAKKWRDKVKNGTMDISTIKDEKLAKKISKYQELYNKAIDCKDAIVELKEKEAELYKQRFDNVAAKFDGIITEYDNHRSILEEFVNQATAKGRIISEKYYTEMQDNENKKLKKLQKERDELLTSLEEAVSSGKIEVGSEAWREMCNSVDEVNLAIEQCNTSLLELEKTMRELKWEQFDLIHDKISQVTSEADFMIDLMSHKKLYDDNGQLTNEGQATMGLHGQNYNVYMEQAKRITSELQELEKEIADDPYNQDLINRRQELLELRQDMVLAAEDEKDAMIDMVKEGIELELDALQELINNYTKALDAQKSLYDYQKKVKSQTEDIAKLQKQLAAYAGDDSEEGKAKRQKLKDSLKSAQEQLEETEYDKYISDQKELLDELYSEYEEVLNKRLDNTDALIGDLIDGVNQNASAISDTLNQAANDVGITLSDELQSIWSSEEPVLTRYGDGIAGSVTSISATLDRIAVSVADMVANSQKEAETDVKKETAKPTSTTTQANATPKTTTTTTKKTTTTTSKTTTTKKSTTSKTGSGNGKAEVGDKVTFKSGKYYETPEGTGKSGSQYLGKSVYITKIDKKAKKPYHISSGKKLGSGNLGWLSLSQLKGYRTGTRRVNDDELAWTNENRDSEVIIRPSDGAILTPLKTGDAVLNHEATSNMFDFASNPEQFLRDIIGTDRIGADMSHVVSAGNTHNGDINMTFDMKDVTNYEEFKYALQHDKSFERMVRAMTTDRLFGKDSHRKYHV